MATHVDDSVGRIVAELKAHDHFDNTIIAFAGDNGGSPPVGGFNYPFRGQKTGMFEGGISTVALVQGPGISSGDPNTGELNFHAPMFHVVDWAPTLLGMSDRRAASAASAAAAAADEAEKDGVGHGGANRGRVSAAEATDRFARAVVRGSILESMSASGKGAATDGSDLGHVSQIDR